MENNDEKDLPREEGYVPRPARQVWLARIGLVLFLLLVIWQMVSMARGWL